NDAKVFPSSSDNRPCLGPPCRLRVRWASSCAESNLLRSGDENVFKNTYGLSFRQHEKASTVLVFSQRENTRTPFDSSSLIMLVIGCSPKAHRARRSLAAFAGSPSWLRSTISDAGKLNRADTQSLTRYENAPAAKAASRSFAVIAERLRKLALSGEGASMSSP